MLVPVRRFAPLLAALGSALIIGAAPSQHAAVPVHKVDFADPFILPHGGEFIAYSTNTAGINLPMASSRDLVTWTSVVDPANPRKRLDGMPALAPWVEKNRTWAPEVIAHGGKWLLYYTARHRARKTQCIGVAVAADPRGPYRDASAEPLVCQYKLGGSIDANPFRDAGGQLYLYYKSDANSLKQWKTQIWGQKLSPDGLRVSGEAVAMLDNDLPWEAHVIEAPTMVLKDGRYVMFYSANHFGWESHQTLSPYAAGYAACTGPLGPCTDAPEPILASYNDRKAGCLSGPGHQVVFEHAGRSFIGFHAWAARGGCTADTVKGRYLYVAPLNWRDGKPSVGPSLRAPAR